MPPSRPVFPLVLAMAASWGAAAETTITVYSAAQPGAIEPQALRSVVPSDGVPGYAFVHETRDVALSAGRTRLRVAGVAALIDPTTVALVSLTHPDSTRVLEQGFEHDVASTALLLRRHLGEEVTVEPTHAGGTRAYSGILVAADDGTLTVQEADGGLRIVSGYSAIRLPQRPGLVAEPTLEWDVVAKVGGTHRARISYRTAGMTWWADYTATYSEPGTGRCRLEFSAWATVLNRSGAAWRDARLQLVAGDVQRVPERRPVQPMMAATRVAEESTGGFEQRPLSEFHLYTLGRPVDLGHNALRQFALYPESSSAGCERRLVFQGQPQSYPRYGAPFTEPQPGRPSNTKVDVSLRVENSGKNGLGMPLPAGRVRVFRRDGAEAAPEFVGEDLIGHTARGETLRLRLGSAFDVVGERRQVDFRVDTAARWMEEDVEVRLRNGKQQEAVDVVVREILYRWSNWTVPRHSHDFRREDARTIEFPVRVPAGGETVVRYTARYTW